MNPVLRKVLKILWAPIRWLLNLIWTIIDAIPFLQWIIAAYLCVGFGMLMAFATEKLFGLSTLLMRLPHGEPEWDSTGTLSAGWVYNLLLWTVVGAILLYLAVKYWHKKASETKEEHIRGSKLSSFKKMRGRAKRELRGGELLWGGLRLPREYAVHHFLAVGSPGSGKTVTLDRLLKSVVDTEANDGNEPTRAIIFDPKAEAYGKLLRLGISPDEITLVMPYLERSPSWDVARDIRRAEDLQELATILFPELDSRDRYFQEAAKNLGLGVLISFRQKWRKKMPERPWSLRDVFLALSDPEDLERIISWCPAENRSRLSYFSEPRTFANIMSTITNRIVPYLIVASYWHVAEEERPAKRFSLEDWVSSRERTFLVLAHSHRAAEPLRSIYGAIFQRAVQLVLDQPETKRPRFWFFLDELSKAGTLPQLDELIIKGRDRGASVVAGFQDIGAVQKQYGPLLGEITGHAGNVAIFRTTESTTRRWAEGAFGQEELWQRSYGQSWSSSASGPSRGGSVNEHKQWRPIVSEAEILNLPNPKTSGSIGGFYRNAAFEEAYYHQFSLKELDAPTEPPTLRARDGGFITPWNSFERAALGLSEIPSDTLRPLPPQDTEPPSPRQQIDYDQ